MDIKQATQIIMCYTLWGPPTDWREFEEKSNWPKGTISDAWDFLEDSLGGMSLMPGSIAFKLENKNNG